MKLQSGSKLTSLDDLSLIRDRKNKENLQRGNADAPESKVLVRVAMATCGIASGAKSIMEFFSDQLNKRNIEGLVTQTGCMGYCYAEPTVEVTLPGKEPIVFGFVDERKADQIIEQYIKSGELVEGVIPVNYKTVENY